MIVVEVHDHLEAVIPELIVKQPVGGLDGGDDSHQVEGFPEGKAELVAVVFVTVTVPVLPLTLGAAVRDGVTPSTLGQLLVTGLATSVTTLPVCHRLWHLDNKCA